MKSLYKILPLVGFFLPTNNLLHAQSESILNFGYNVTVLDKPAPLEHYVENLNSLKNFTTPIVAPTALNGFTFGWVGHGTDRDIGFGFRQNTWKTEAVVANNNNTETNYTYKFKMNQFYLPALVFYPSKSVPIGIGTSLDAMSFKVSRKDPEDNRFFVPVTSDVNLGGQLLVRLRFGDESVAFTITGFYQKTIFKSDFGEYKGEPNTWSPSGYGVRAALGIPFGK